VKFIKNYNIHDILKFRIIRNKEHNLRDLINLKFSFFNVEELDDLDIILNIGKFTPSNMDCYLVDHKYYIKENYLYCRDSEGKATWDVEISGLKDKTIIINFNGEIKGFQSLMNSDFVAQNLLLRLMEYKFAGKQYYFAHSAGISKGKQAHVFAGRGGTFKTSLCMDFVRRAGFEFLGDDRVILHRDKVLNFPMGLRVFSFMCDNLPNENSWNLAKKGKFAKHLWETRKEKYSTIEISKSAKLKSLLLIAKTNSKTITVREISSKEVVDRLAANNRLEDFVSLGGLGINSGPHLKYMLAYSYIFPDSYIAKSQEESKKIIRDIVENIPIYEVEVPSKYSLSYFNKIHELVKNA
jgi:hypothetical protein